MKDTLTLAKELHPGKRNSLDARCERYRVNNTHRTLHGALLDAELLAEVYLAMTRGRESPVMELEQAPAGSYSDAGVPVERYGCLGSTTLLKSVSRVNKDEVLRVVARSKMLVEAGI